LTQCGPINNWGKGLVMGLTLFSVEYFPAVAFQLACNMMLQNYEIHKGTSSERWKCIASKLFARKPFLQGINMSKF